LEAEAAAAPEEPAPWVPDQSAASAVDGSAADKPKKKIFQMSWGDM